MTLQGDIRGHEDRRVIVLLGGTAVVRQVHGGTLEQLQEEVIGVTGELELVPQDGTVGTRTVLGEPVPHTHVVGAGKILDRRGSGVAGLAKEAGLTDTGRPHEEQVTDLEGPTAAVGDHLVELVDNGLVAGPGVEGEELLWGQPSLDEGPIDVPKTGLLLEEHIAPGLLLLLHEGDRLGPVGAANGGV